MCIWHLQSLVLPVVCNLMVGSTEGRAKIKTHDWAVAKLFVSSSNVLTCKKCFTRHTSNETKEWSQQVWSVVNVIKIELFNRKEWCRQHRCCRRVSTCVLQTYCPLFSFHAVWFWWNGTHSTSKAHFLTWPIGRARSTSCLSLLMPQIIKKTKNKGCLIASMLKAL